MDLLAPFRRVPRSRSPTFLCLIGVRTLIGVLPVVPSTLSCCFRSPSPAAGESTLLASIVTAPVGSTILVNLPGEASSVVNTRLDGAAGRWPRARHRCHWLVLRRHMATHFWRR
jgi:hypothetical protein